MRAMWARRGPFRLRRLRPSSHRLAGGARRPGARRRSLPALRAGAHGCGSHGPVRQHCPAAQHDADGGPDRHAHQPDQGQRAGHEQADRVVRAEPDRARAHALPRRRAPGLSGLRAARRLHVHEHRPPPQGASRPLREPGQGRAGEGEDHQGVLRRVLRRARPRRRVLPGDGGLGVPGGAAGQGRARLIAASASSPAPSAARRC